MIYVTILAINVTILTRCFVIAFGARALPSIITMELVTSWSYFASLASEEI